MTASGLFLQKHPNEMVLWQLRVVSAISLNDQSWPSLRISLAARWRKQTRSFTLQS